MQLFRRFRHHYHVQASMRGYLYHQYRLQRVLEPGIYSLWDWQQAYSLILLPVYAKQVLVLNQEVLTHDSIAFRCSFYYLYRISDGELFLQQFGTELPVPYLLDKAETRLSTLLQLALRAHIGSMDSQELSEKRSQLVELKSEELVAECAQYGIELNEVRIKDITFPRAIQELFAKQLEARIRAKVEIENARTAVATARALKNASEMMKGDDNVRFLHWLEALQKISAQGRHSFQIGHFGNPPQL